MDIVCVCVLVSCEILFQWLYICVEIACPLGRPTASRHRFIWLADCVCEYICNNMCYVTVFIL